MGKRLAIKGHPTRGKEVMELLEMMGGKNSNGFICSSPNRFYYILNEYFCLDYIDSEEINEYIIFTLEEFLEKYPFKVGDKVHIPEYESEVHICEMKWDPLCNYMEYMVYRNDDPEWYNVEELLKYNDNFLENKHCNEKQVNGMKSVLAELLDHIKNTSKEELEKEFNELEEWSNIGPTVEEFMDFCNKVNKKLKYPTTYEECCEVIGINRYDIEIDIPQPYQQKMFNLFKLIICRDAYWKIAGEEMGLDKSWESPLPSLFETVYCIRRKNNEIIKGSYRGGKSEILEFPTEEMRNTFFENFKDLIKSCKELL